jgi:hypothetical protein
MYPGAASERIAKEVARSRRAVQASFLQFCAFEVGVFTVFATVGGALGPRGNNWIAPACGLVGVVLCASIWWWVVALIRCRYLVAVLGKPGRVDLAALLSYDSAGELLATEVSTVLRGREDFVGKAAALIRHFSVIRDPEEWLSIYDRLLLQTPGCTGLLEPLYLGWGVSRSDAFVEAWLLGFSRVGDLIEKFGGEEYSIVSAARFCELGAQGGTKISSGEEILAIYDRAEATADALVRGILV